MTVSHTAIRRTCAQCRQAYPYKEVHICASGAAPPPVAVDDLLGTVLGDRYRIESFVQRGGMGSVYLARHTVLDKPIAIKILNQAKDEVAQKRFLLEAKSACHINHEHIVDITDFGVLADGRPYLVMEFLQGQPLDAVIARGPLSPRRVCRIAEQIALGLQAVHDKGILHRDLKPGNVFLLERYRKDYVKILDFGIAKVVSDSPGLPASSGGGLAGAASAPYRPTQEGMVLGTPEYLAPEQALGEDLDHRVDQYALGCILYEMLTGDVPFKGNSAMGTVVKRLSDKVVPPRQRRPDLNIPVSLEAVTLRALSREREQRFANMNELALALQNEFELLGGPAGDNSSSSISASMMLSAISNSPPTPTPTPLPIAIATLKPPATLISQPMARAAVSPKPKIIAAGLGIGLLGLVGLAVALFRPAPNTDLVGLAKPATSSSKPSLGQVQAPAPPASTSAEAKEPPKRTSADLGEDKDRAAAAGNSAIDSRFSLSFENASPVAVTVSCSHQRPCRVDAQKICQFKIGSESGKCEASAPGYKPRVFSYRELRARARAGHIKERVLLDARGLGEIKL